MYKTQQQQIRKLNKEQYELLHKLCYHSARLYNYCLFLTKKQWDETHTFLRYETGYFTFKENDNYKILPSAPAQQTCKLVERSFKSYLSLLKLATEGGYVNPISSPNFLPKKSCFTLIVPRNGFQIKNGKIHIGISLELKRETGMKNLVLNFPKNIDQTRAIKELRIHPKHRARYFVLDVVYEVVEEKKLKKDRIISVDLGLNNLATCFDGNRAFIIDGRKIKGINYCYNKMRSKLQSAQNKEDKRETHRLFLMTRKRNRRIKDYMRKAANKIMNYVLQNEIGTIVVGHNKGWKDKINIGKINNQNFVQVPFGLLMSCLNNKCKECGINYKEVIESHTSKCSFLDNESIKHHDKYVGKRVKRGLFRSANGILINADVNGAANIGRKVTASDCLTVEQVKGIVAYPVRIIA